MSKLEQLLEKFTNDTSWNTVRPNGSHRFDKEIEWIGRMVREYAEALGMTTDEVVDIMEKGRDYSWPNYYQPCNFPPLDKDHIIGIFKTFEEFRNHSKEHWIGFRCPKCGNVGRHPQECDHRTAKDGVCDWCSYGLFTGPVRVVILEDGLKSIPIFEPVQKEG